MEIKISKRTIKFSSVAMVIVVIMVLVYTGAPRFVHRMAGHETMSSGVPNVLAAKFEHLSGQGTNSCGGGKDAVNYVDAEGRLQGSCCGPMVLHSYEEQIEELKKYAEYEIIPPDPYDVSAVWAREMISYSENTQLSGEQQAIYSKAVEMSHEKGPCCCVCWHWYAYEGLAKHLIINEGFSAQQIAEVWDLSDACGGEHAH